MKRDPKQPWFVQAALLAGIPIMLAAGPLCGYVIGRFLDRVFNTGSVLMILFIVIGGIAGVREMINLIKRVS